MEDFTMLENNAEVITELAHRLGLSENYEFKEVYSLEKTHLEHVPRPCLALLVILPLTPAWQRLREEENETMSLYEGHGPNEPVIWFKQTIPGACGAIGLIHSCLNGAAKHIVHDSILQQIQQACEALGWRERAKLLESCHQLRVLNEEFALKGDTAPILDHRLGHHFVAFVKGSDGHLYELEGGRKGPLDRGLVDQDDDVLSEVALDRQLRKYMNLAQQDGEDLRFSCIALSRRT